MCHTEHVFRQGSLPGGAHNLNETQHIHAGHKHRVGGIFEGHRWSGEPRAGAYSVFKHCPSGCLCGGGRGEQDIAQDGLRGSSVVQEGLAGGREPQRAVVSGTGRAGKFLSVVLDEETQRSEGRRTRQKVQEETLSPWQEAVTSAKPSCPCFQAAFSRAIFPEKA